MFLSEKRLVMLKALVLSFQPAMCKVVTTSILENIYKIVLVFALYVTKIYILYDHGKRKCILLLFIFKLNIYSSFCMSGF